MSMKTLNVGTLNVQGCQLLKKQKTICQDMFKYDLQILGITETHVKKKKTEKIAINMRTYTYISWMHNRRKCILRNRNSNRRLSETTFSRIADRILHASIKVNNNKWENIIVAYAPTHTRIRIR